MKKLVFIFFLILFLKEVIAIGIVTNVLENNTLELMEGTSITYQIQLQNTEEEMKVRLVLNSEIAKIMDYKEEYILPKGVSHTPVIFNITAPKNANVGDEYTINYYVEPLSAKGGAIRFGIKMNKNFKVKIIENPNKPEPSKENHLYKVIIGSLLLVLFVIIYIKKYKK